MASKGSMIRRRGDRVTRWVCLAMLACLLALAGCQGRNDKGSSTKSAVEEQLPTEAQWYLALSKANLSALVNVDPEEITLESLITPAEWDGVYEIQLVVSGHVYEYWGQAEEIKLVRERVVDP